ncbi:MAG: glycine cleavage system protein H [Candidatus Helarchaeota archaeon]|nr:glycine cleavage system protein H [Candidatus Helarchaeota archaeon]
MVKVGDYELPDELYYYEQHTWVKVEGDLVRVGLDTIGLSRAGKIVFIRVKKGKVIKQGKTFGTAEAGKGVIPLYAPINGEIVEGNPKVEKRNVTALNDDPYGEGWIVKMNPSNLEEDLKVLKHGDDVVPWAEEEIKKIDE